MKHCLVILVLAYLFAYVTLNLHKGNRTRSNTAPSEGCMQMGIYLQGSIEPLKGKQLPKDFLEIYLDTSTSFEFVSNFGKLFSKGAGSVVLGQLNIDTSGIHSFDDSIKKGKRKVWLLNYSNDSIALPGGNLDLNFIAVLEAKDKDGRWKPIQYALKPKPYIYNYIPPRSAGSFIAEIPNTGSFETQFRFKVLGKSEFYYSNQFKGRMNECEFVQDTSTYDRVNGVLHPAYKLEYTVGELN